MSAPPTSAVSHRLRIQTQLVPGEATVSLVGELDITTAPSLEDTIALLGGEGVERLVIDMAGLEFIDTSGLHQLVMARKRQDEHGGEVVLRSPRPHALRVLEITGMTGLFTIT